MEVSRSTAERMRDAVVAVFGPLEQFEDGKRKRFRIAARGLGNFATAPTAAELADLENSARANEAGLDPVRAVNGGAISGRRGGVKPGQLV